MQKPKYWIYNPKTNSGREVFTTQISSSQWIRKFLLMVFFLLLMEKHISLNRKMVGMENGALLFMNGSNQEKRKSLLQPKQILMGLAKNLELPSKIKNEILSDCGELQNANS
jgi:hypothetical protein